jgi:hypothetical protein
MDSIGRVRAGTVQPATPETAAAPKPGSSTPFQVDKTEAPTSTAPVSGPLAAFRAGTLDRKGFIEAHVDQATAHLTLSPEAKERIRADLQERCENDPTLLGLIEHATRTDQG